MSPMIARLIWAFRKDGFKKQVVDEGTGYMRTRELPTPRLTVPPLTPLDEPYKETLFVRRWTNAPSGTKCANCGCNPEGEYYEEQ